MHRARIVSRPLINTVALTIAFFITTHASSAASISSRLLIDPVGEHDGDIFGSSVASVGDVNGDGYDDVVEADASYQSFSGLVTLYLGGAGGLQPSPAWTAVGTQSGSRFGTYVAPHCEINGDGKNDLLWQNASTGEMDVWFMNGATRLGAAALNPSKPTNLTWKLTAVGDFNADGKPDLVFRQAVVGELQIWLMNGAARTATQGLLGVNYPGEVPTTPTRVLFDVTWEVVAPR